MEKHFRAWLHYCTLFGVYLTVCHELKEHSVLCLTETSQMGRKHLTWLQKSNRYSGHFFLQCLHVFVLLSTLCVLYMHGIYWRGITPQLMLTWVVATLIFTSQVCTNVVIIMEAVCKKSQHEAFLQLLGEIEVALKLRLREDVQQVALYKSVRSVMVLIVICSFFSFTTFIITSKWLNYTGYFWHGLLSIITLRLRFIQLVLYVRTLRHYLQCLCTKLRQIEAYHMAPEQRMLDINYEKLASLDYLLAIKEIYALLHKAFHLLNDFAGWSLFSIIAGYCFDFSCNLYWTLLSVDGYVMRRYYYIAGPVAALPYVTLIWYLSYLCDNCKELGHTAAHLLCRIIIMSSTKSLGLHRLVLYQLILQLQLQRIEVTAKHFFVLEQRLLMKIFTAVAMNLVILIQFLKS